jgi:hypothetical protein
MTTDEPNNAIAGDQAAAAVGRSPRRPLSEEQASPRRMAAQPLGQPLQRPSVHAHDLSNSFRAVKTAFQTEPFAPSAQIISVEQSVFHAGTEDAVHEPEKPVPSQRSAMKYCTVKKRYHDLSTWF